MSIQRLFFAISIFLSYSLFAQQYVDLLKIDQGQIQNVGFEDIDGTTLINDFNVKLTYPIKINKNKNLLMFFISVNKSLISLILKVS